MQGMKSFDLLVSRLDAMAAPEDGLLNVFAVDVHLDRQRGQVEGLPARKHIADDKNTRIGVVGIGQEHIQLEMMRAPASIDRIDGHDDVSDGIAHYGLAVGLFAGRQIAAQAKGKLPFDHRGVAKIGNPEARRAVLGKINLISR